MIVLSGQPDNAVSAKRCKGTVQLPHCEPLLSQAGAQPFKGSAKAAGALVDAFRKMPVGTVQSSGCSIHCVHVLEQQRQAGLGCGQKLQQRLGLPVTSAAGIGWQGRRAASAGKVPSFCFCSANVQQICVKLLSAWCKT